MWIFAKIVENLAKMITWIIRGYQNRSHADCVSSAENDLLIACQIKLFCSSVTNFSTLPSETQSSLLKHRFRPIIDSLHKVPANFDVYWRTPDFHYCNDFTSQFIEDDNKLQKIIYHIVKSHVVIQESTFLMYLILQLREGMGKWKCIF